MRCNEHLASFLRGFQMADDRGSDVLPIQVVFRLIEDKRFAPFSAEEETQQDRSLLAR